MLAQHCEGLLPPQPQPGAPLHPDVQSFLDLLQARLHQAPPTRAEALATARLVAAFARLLLLLPLGTGGGGGGAEQGSGAVSALLAQLATLSDRVLSQLG